MPIAVAPNPRAASPDDLDDLFNYDTGIDESFANTNDDAAPTTANGNNPVANPQPAANLDEEIKVIKKRQPVAKLDEERILSKGGIPKLRKISKSIRFKGKGHEFSDMARLLNTYQLWLDDLYPRAKFADGLSMVEKLGHKKRMQVMRRAWIDEGKPRPEEPDEEEPPQDDREREPSQSRTEGVEAQAQGDSTAVAAESQAQGNDWNGGQEADDGPEEDELDALLAESAIESGARVSLFGSGVPAGQAHAEPPDRESFEDDEEAMAGMEW